VFAHINYLTIKKTPKNFLVLPVISFLLLLAVAESAKAI
jgi:hypothetical protein